ncbi:probable serine/threonine-protein kinase kinX [Lytechinus pictus]|uniref:probable serine/threonine-protein kinase kinX n=1 Tax=Lytechinus pictus TaxID=7653 RepID=UPI0030B9B008
MTNNWAIRNQEDRQNDETDVQKVENVVASQNREVDDTQLKQDQETEDGPVDIEGDNTPDDDDDDDDRGQEVINYQDIQVDHDSKVTSENEGKNKETDSKNEEEEEEDGTFDDLIEDDDGEQFADENEPEMEKEEEEEESEYMLTPAAARELMLELRDPVEVAKFVVETDDAAGFLRALRLLLHDGYISEEEAYALKDEVAAQLRNLLMLQQVELSRALFETYQPQLEEGPTEDLDGLLYNQMAQPAEYYDYANMINQDEVPYGSSQMNLYDAYQDTIEQESSQALAEIAEILAQRIARGEISPEDGAKIMSKVVQLLPDNYWGESEEGISSVDLGLSSQTSEFIGEDEPMERYGQVEPEMENFEEELLAQGPDAGWVKEIKETDQNGDEDAVELDEEAENIADELEDELREGGKPSKTESIEINKPGADAVVKVGPSNDVIDEDVEKNWKDMSLLLDNDIPEDILRSLGIAMTKPGNKYENEMEDKMENEMKELETKEEDD